MKYKVTEYNSDFQEEQTGTCDLCYGTAWVENGSITVEDENGNETEIEENEVVGNIHEQPELLKKVGS